MMYKNLDPTTLGVAAVRQSELIELTLSYKFAGFTLDLSDFDSQLKHGSLEHVGRLIASAKLQLGAFELPISWTGNDEVFATEKGRLIRLAKAAKDIGAGYCRLTVPPANDERPYQEQFETCRRRISEIGEVLATEGIRLAVNFDGQTAAREGFAYQFLNTFDELTKLIDACDGDNVGLCIDTWQWHRCGGDMSQLTSLPTGKVVAVDLADSTAAAGDETATNESRRLPGEGGNIDAVAILKWLDSIEFAGPITPVPSPASFGELSREAILERTRIALLKQWIGAELTDEELPPEPVVETPEPDTVEEAAEEAPAETGATEESDEEAKQEVGAADE